MGVRQWGAGRRPDGLRAEHHRAVVTIVRLVIQRNVKSHKPGFLIEYMRFGMGPRKTPRGRKEYCRSASLGMTKERAAVKATQIDRKFGGAERTCGSTDLSWKCFSSAHPATRGSQHPRRYDVSMSPSPEVLDRAKKIKLFLMDVDGTITDGSVNLISLPNDGGVAEMKAFNSQDGAGLKLAHIMGIRTGFITGRKSPAVTQRAHELSVEFVYLGQETKTAAFNDCLQKAGVREEETAYMGDDLPDIPVARRAGLAIAVANAAPELKAVCHFVTNARGGDGSAREIVELILRAQGRWEEAVPRALA